MNLTIVTINYNGSESTIKLLKTLENQTDRDFKVIVVDNASQESDFNRLTLTKAAFAKAAFVVVRNEENLGFSGGNNVGIRHALENGADWVLLLNNDTWVDKGFISSLKAKLGDQRGVVGIPIDEGDGSAYCGKIMWLQRPGPHYHIRDMHEARSRKRKYAIGAGMAIHKDVFSTIGFLDEKYFLYFEDIDFSTRAYKAKIPITISYGVMIHHNVSSSTKELGLPLLLYYQYRNVIYYNWRNGPWYVKILSWFWAQWILKKQLLKILLNINREESKAILEGVYDYYTGKFGKK